jgi:hypothetical protein
MSFERQGDTIIFFCDVCEREFRFQTDSFVTAYATAETHRWTTNKPIGRPWRHYCPHCRAPTERSRSVDQASLSIGTIVSRNIKSRGGPGGISQD